MGRIKAQDVDWHHEAWSAMLDLQDVNEYPTGYGLLSTTPLAAPTTKWKLPPAVKISLQSTLQRLTLHLFYRLNVAHGVKKPTNISGTHWFHDITDPFELLITWVYLKSESKSEFTSGDDVAIEAAFRLASVLQDRYCNAKWKREIPLLISGVGGKSTIEHARRIAGALRGQKSSRLADGLARCLARTPDATWKELLDDLTGDEIVTMWDHEFVHWLDYETRSCVSKTTTFRNLITKLKKLR